MKHSTGLRNYALVNGIATAFDGGEGRVAVLGGPAITNPNAAVNLTINPLLATLVLSVDAMTSANDGEIGFLNISRDLAADATGTPSNVIIYLADQTPITSAATGTDRRLLLSASVGAGGDVVFNRQVYADGEVEVVDLTYIYSE